MSAALVLGLVAVPLLQEPAATDEPQRDPRVWIGSVDFTTDEVDGMLELSPLPAPPPDPTNAVYENEHAARLGQAIFYDTGFSRTGTVSCATCHVPEKSFTDGKRRGVGIDVVRRNTMSLWNVAHNRWFFWDGRRDTLWAQALAPLEDPLEHDLSRMEVVHKIAADPGYRRGYENTFGPLPDVSDATRFPAAAQPVFDIESERGQAWREMQSEDRELVNRVFSNVGKAIAAYERKLVTPEAPFDAYVRGLREGKAVDQRSITDSAKRGLRLFLGKARCHFCHFGPNFTDREFHDTRLDGDPPEGPDLGRYLGIQEVTVDPFNGIGPFSDDPTGEAEVKVGYLRLDAHTVREFKTPSLRNARFTAPYMHDGRFDTLEEVVAFYNTLEDAAPRKAGEKLLVPLNLDERELADLVEFLESLSATRLPRELTTAPPTPYLEE